MAEQNGMKILRFHYQLSIPALIHFNEFLIYKVFKVLIYVQR